MTKGGRTDAVHGSRGRNALRNTETTSGGWRVVGVVEIQVEDVTRQERRWGVVVTARER